MVTMKQKHNSQENNQNFFDKWVFPIGAIVVIIAYAVASVLGIIEKYIVDILLFIFHLSAAYYLSTKIAKRSLKQDAKQAEEKIANIAVRHLRGSLRNVRRLMSIIDKRTSELSDTKGKQYLREIKNHIESLYDGLLVSQTDFSEIVSKDLQREGEIEKEITEVMAKAQETKEKLADVETDKGIIKELNRKLAEQKFELHQRMLSLPFGPTGPTGMPSGSIDFDNDLDSDFLNPPTEPTGPQDLLGPKSPKD